MLGDRQRHALLKAGQDEMIDVADRHAGFLEQARHGRRYQLQVSLVTNPAFFPFVVEFEAVHAVVIHEIASHRMRFDKPCHHAFVADHQRRGRVAREHFQARPHPGAAMFRADHQRRAAAGPHGIERAQHAAGGGPLTAADVHRPHRGRQVQGLADDHGILSIEKGMGGGSEKQRRDAVARRGVGCVSRSCHGHGHGVFVPVANAPFSAGQRSQGRVEPTVRPADRFARGEVWGYTHRMT